VSDLEYLYHTPVVVYVIDYSVFTDPDMSSLFSSERATVARARIVREGLEDILCAVLCGYRGRGYLLLCPPLIAYRVGHQSPVTFPSRISRMARSSGYNLFLALFEGRFGFAVGPDVLQLFELF
jgi:hypothetical protein